MAGGLSSIDWGTVIGTGILFSVLSLTHLLLNDNALIIPLVLVGYNRVALWLYTLLLLPGIILHELSHAATALILLVNVYDLHVGPEIVGNQLWLGYVIREKTDVVRGSIIGLAPLIIGTGVIYIVGDLTFDIAHIHDILVVDGWLEAIRTLGTGLSNGWSWVAIYFIFAVSANMFPSRSDRRNWLPAALFLLLIFIIGAAAGIAGTLVQWLAEPINTMFRWLLFTFGLTLTIDLPILLLLAAGTRAVTKQPRSM